MILQKQILLIFLAPWLIYSLNAPAVLCCTKKRAIRRPSLPGWSLNMAVDVLLKQEFDSYRQQQKPHEKYQLNLTSKYGEPINCVPYQHKDIDIWRNP